MTSPEPGKPRRRGWLWLVLLVAVVACGAFLWNRQAAQQANAKPGFALRTAKVRTGPLERTIRLTGMTVAEKMSVITAPMMIGTRSGGRHGDFSLILQQLAPNGVLVKKGDQVAGLDQLLMQLRVDEYETVVKDHENYQKILYTQLEIRRKSQEQKIRAAKGAYERAQLDLKTAPVRSEIAVEKFRIAAEEAKARLGEYEAESEPLDISDLAAIRRIELDLQQCRLEAKRARNNMDKMLVRAPLDGLTVIQTTHRGSENVMIQAGDQLAPGQQFMQIVDTSSMIIAASVNQVDAETLRLNAKARISFDAFPGLVLPAKVYSIGAFARAGTFRRSFLSEIPVRMRFEKLDPRVIPNFSVGADVVLEAKESATVVPLDSIFEDDSDGKTYAYVRAGELWERRPIEVGLRNNVAAEVVSGLREGDEVAADRPPADLLADSSR